MDSGGNGVDEGCQVSGASDFFQPPTPLKLVADRQEIGWLTSLVQVTDGFVDPTVLFAVEIIGDEKGGDPQYRLGVNEKRAEDRFLGFYVAGRQSFHCHKSSLVATPQITQIETLNEVTEHLQPVLFV